MSILKISLWLHLKKFNLGLNALKNSGGGSKSLVDFAWASILLFFGLSVNSIRIWNNLRLNITLIMRKALILWKSSWHFTIIYLVAVNPTCTINYSQISKELQNSCFTIIAFNARSPENFKKQTIRKRGEGNVYLQSTKTPFSSSFLKKRTNSSMKRKNNLSLHLFISFNLFFSFLLTFFFLLIK